MFTCASLFEGRDTAQIGTADAAQKGRVAVKCKSFIASPSYSGRQSRSQTRRTQSPGPSPAPFPKLPLHRGKYAKPPKIAFITNPSSLLMQHVLTAPMGTPAEFAVGSWECLPRSEDRSPLGHCPHSSSVPSSVSVIVGTSSERESLTSIAAALEYGCLRHEELCYQSLTPAVTYGLHTSAFRKRQLTQYLQTTRPIPLSLIALFTVEFLLGGFPCADRQPRLHDAELINGRPSRSRFFGHSSPAPSIPQPTPSPTIIIRFLDGDKIIRVIVGIVLSVNAIILAIQTQLRAHIHSHSPEFYAICDKMAHICPQNALKNSAILTIVNKIREMPFSTSTVTVLKHFTAHPPATEDKWYGPWNSILKALFRDEDNYIVTPQQRIPDDSESHIPDFVSEVVKMTPAAGNTDVTFRTVLIVEIKNSQH
ncbi:hypothetical protein B0H14DRAFT_2624558 [Mycena olivaceomarginata]|nr:hypothetical protein B0H14DRAFT_2624558 [Mycena olivaceomarginata]